MGVYCYTLRKDVKNVDGLKIARYGYAYKDSFWCNDPVYRRTQARAHSFAERAYDNLIGEVDHVIIGEWEYAEKDRLPIMKINKLPEYYIDSHKFLNGDYEVIGYLVKVGRKLKIERV